jgi:ABC-type amino acid transport system permease subunit
VISAILSLLLGIVCWIVPNTPLVTPILGLALGLNAIIRYKRQPDKPLVLWAGVAGLVICGVAVIMMLIRAYL